jgi:hypothetical protein
VSVPGSNLLQRALNLIAPFSVSYYAYTGRETNDAGYDIPSYAEAVTIRGSLQSVDKAMYALYGLDLQKTYFVFYVSQNIIDIQRDVSNDYIVFNSVRYNCESNKANWFQIDGWVGTLCVLDGPFTPPPPPEEEDP